MEELINRIVLALLQITTPRYYTTERGFVTEFYCQLKAQLDSSDLFPEHTILESEVQKRRSRHHGLRQRPDLIIHIPVETGLTNHTNENNFVVFAFKLIADPDDLEDDFGKLDEMIMNLNYQHAVFINIGSYPAISLNDYHGNYPDRMHAFSIGLDENGFVQIRHSCFVNDEVISTEK